MILPSFNVWFQHPPCSGHVIPDHDGQAAGMCTTSFLMVLTCGKQNCKIVPYLDWQCLEVTAVNFQVHQPFLETCDVKT